MSQKTKGPGSYVQEVTEGTIAYVNDLKQELLLLRTRISMLELEKRSMSAELESVRRMLEHRKVLVDEQYAIIEQQNANLANLYVASYRLHDTLERAELLIVIQEIVANLIGSEELAIFELGPDGTSLKLVHAAGVPAAPYASLTTQSGLIGRAVRDGEVTLVQAADRDAAPAHEKDLTACVPLKLQGRVTGAIAIFRLLSQKPELASVDHELFDLLATHAANAMYCTSLHAARAHMGAG